MADADILIIANPNAGNHAGARLREALATRPRFRLCETKGAGHAEDLAAEAIGDGWSTVAAAGGDGTINEVVNGLEAAFDSDPSRSSEKNSSPRVRLGLLTLGTGNDFARTLGLPPTLDEQLDLLEGEHASACDVGRVSGPGFSRLFLNMSVGGASGEVSDRVDTELKNFWGPLAYMRAAIETLPMLEPYELRLELEDGDAVDERPLNLIVANGRFVAAGIPVAPRAQIDDGLLDVLLFKAEDLATLSALTLRVLAGEHLEIDSEQVVFHRARRLEIESRPEMPFNTDGERLPAQPNRFEILPGALDIALPAP